MEGEDQPVGLARIVAARNGQDVLSTEAGTGHLVGRVGACLERRESFAAARAGDGIIFSGYPPPPPPPLSELSVVPPVLLPPVAFPPASGMVPWAPPVPTRPAEPESATPAFPPAACASACEPALPLALPPVPALAPPAPGAPPDVPAAPLAFPSVPRAVSPDPAPPFRSEPPPRPVEPT